MSNSVVVVESPAKAKTIEKYLGGGFKVLASYGHVRDLIPKEGAVDTENNYAMRYDVIERNEKHVKAISSALKKADTLYLATDPDREGEAISWHLYELLKERGVLKDKEVRRVVFYEITKRAIQEAMDTPRELSNDLISAQQARRALDYLVGFNLSPLLWKKIKPGLSAGRVQSPALRMIVEREEEVEAFKPREYWTLEGDIRAEEGSFNGRLAEYRSEKVEQFTFEDQAGAEAARDAVLAAADGKVRVQKIDRKQRKRNPAAPFTTSTLQQEASRKLGFNTQRTMRTAQGLYEGIETDEGTVGLITYMRTDSVSLAAEAVEEIRDLIAERYGTENVPAEPREYKTKSKNAQEAHEGVRPTSVERTPESLKDRLEPDQFKLYSLIWKRAVASQMVPAIFNTVAIDLLPESKQDEARLRANGSTLVEPGFIAVYQEGSDDVKDDEADRTLPPVEEGQVLDLTDFRADQHFTDPPPRYTEASLVKALEEYGIGRPSTYASIISTLKNREYVEMDGKRFLPTDIGRIVSSFLTNHFTQYVDYDFTAQLEDVLDEVSRGEREWVPVLEDFWGPFHKLVENKEESVSREEAAQARQLGTDPKSGKPVSVRMGRYGPFVQIGTKDDEDKPKFAGLKPGQKITEITFEEAMELFKLPRKLGETPEGEKVSASIGRFGPYVRYDDKFVSIRGDDPYTITLEAALEFIKQKKIDDANKLILDFPDDGIQVLNGRYGPYVTNKEKNARVPKDREPNSLTLEECKELLEKAPVRGKRGKKKKVAKKAAKKKAKKKSKKKKNKKKKAKKKTRKAVAAEADPGIPVESETGTSHDTPDEATDT
ncbi:MAG: DNA topoisomerase I [Gammaproteobacteria bacterium]|jgi:DNA topoisomerase-1|nr:DNA topoisomerase I [Gammaproteobacteria bacterium]MDP6617528.1 DNA topoisomerase I [Gammaproteobacteria bacterium]MDP6694405.1 DNA topoisomerase I [Gammaproteobacteria bacterium]MDP7041208.1 DNA topoisomerase I [Gammaproteobacteria bacterium]